MAIARQRQKEAEARRVSGASHSPLTCEWRIFVDIRREGTIWPSFLNSTRDVGLQAGVTLGERYRLDELLGRGAVGEVWRGYDADLDRQVAVKVVLERIEDPELVRFQREAKLAARLHHPGIAVVHDIGTHDGQPFIVMELLDGRDLQAVLSGSPAGLPVIEAVRLVAQAAEALQVAHKGHVIHRDLKPANLFVQSNGQLKICDFGVAWAADSADSIMASYILGTPAYMSPEECDGREVDERSDIYSLGCVLFALLTGRPPFLGRPLEVMACHRAAAPQPPRLIRSDIPRDLEALVLRLLDKDPVNRPVSAAEVAQALQRLPVSSGTAPQAAGPVSELTSASQPARAYRDPRAVPRAPAPSAALASARGTAPADRIRDPGRRPAGFGGDGLFVVGLDIQPGVYRTDGPARGQRFGTCLLLTSTSSRDIENSVFVRGPVTITVRPGITAVEVRGCRPWQRLGDDLDTVIQTAGGESHTDRQIDGNRQFGLDQADDVSSRIGETFRHLCIAITLLEVICSFTVGLKPIVVPRRSGESGGLQAGDGAKFILVRTKVLNDSMGGIDLTCSLPIQTHVIDDRGRRFDSIRDLYQIAGNPGCGDRLQPGFAGEMTWAYRVPLHAKISGFEFEDWIDVNGDRSEKATRIPLAVPGP